MLADIQGNVLGDMAIKDLSPKDSNIGHRLVKNMRICGSGIYTYMASEAPLLGLAPIPECFGDMKTINVYRPPEVLYDNKDKFARIPIITGRHVLVNEQNAKQLTVGMVGDSVQAEVSKDDGEMYLYTTGTLVAGDGIDAYKEWGQLSVGYVPKMRWQSGVHKGQEYQAVLTGFDCVNHLLICPVARGGPQCMVMDSMPLGLMNNGGTKVNLFQKVFSSGKSAKIAGDVAVVSALLQSIAVGADPAVQVAKIRELVGDADPVFNSYLDELSKGKGPDPAVLSKVVDMASDYYTTHMAGDAEDGTCPKCHNKPCTCGDKAKTEGDKMPPQLAKEADEGKDVETKGEGAPTEAEKKPAGDKATKGCGDALEIDYDKLADMVANKLKPQINGDEASEALKHVSPSIAGDSTQKAGSDELFKEIWG